MTNFEAYRNTFNNPNGEGAMRLTLTINGIDPDTSENNELTVAFAIHDQVMGSDFSQGGTSETLSPSARSLLIRKAKAIFLKYGISDPFQEGSSKIDGVTW